MQTYQGYVTKMRTTGNIKSRLGRSSYRREDGPSESNVYVGTKQFAIEQLTTTSHPGPPFKEGGAFWLKRLSFVRTMIPWSYQGGPYPSGGYITSFGYDSQVFPVSPYGRPLEIDAVSFQKQFDAGGFPSSDLTALGAQAWDRFNPLASQANLAQTLAELKREGLPKVPGIGDIRALADSLRRTNQGGVKFRPSKAAKRRGRDLSRLGGEYLNVVFGWRPLVSDLRALYDAWKNLDTSLAQIEKDNNKGIRRRGVVSKTTTVVNRESQAWYGNLSPPFRHSVDSGSPVGSTELTVIETQKVWFSARFRYNIPMADIASGEWKREATRNLFGLKVTPSVLWELMPWSWLIDWFFNVGNVLENLDPKTGDLYADYAYIMRHTERTKTVTTRSCSQVVEFPNVVARKKSYLFTEVETFETKERIAATPLGFGYTKTSPLTGKQWAILAALGLSRSNLSLPDSPPSA